MNTTQRNAENKMATRSEKETIRRRKRSGGGELHGRRLGVAESMLDFDNFAYRWINDAPSRIHAKTKEDDWDVMTNNGEKDDSADLGSAITQVVGTKADGSPMLAYLCRKPRKFFDEDKQEKLDQLQKQLASLKRGADRNGEAQSDYIPNEGISLS